MRNNVKKLAIRAVAIPGLIALTIGTALAQTAPAVPTTAAGLAQSIDKSDIQAAGLAVVGLLVSVGVVLWGARLVESKFKPKV